MYLTNLSKQKNTTTKQQLNALTQQLSTFLSYFLTIYLKATFKSESGEIIRDPNTNEPRFLQDAQKIACDMLTTPTVVSSVFEFEAEKYHMHTIVPITY
jgi:hypothetical protein